MNSLIAYQVNKEGAHFGLAVIFEGCLNSV